MTTLAVESGRIAIVPVQPTFATPMLDFCIMTPVTIGKQFVHVRTCKHPKKIKKRRVLSIVIGEFSPMATSKILATSPTLIIGDATFIYVDRRRSAEYERAVQACKNEGSMAGAYRTEDGQIATSVRLGDKEVSVDVMFEQGQIVITPKRTADPLACRPQ